MKIDRLLSIIIYLLNRSLVSARELAERFEVSHRTIQRDMETINAAGIPIITIQGPSGGYGIIENWKMDRQLLSPDDLFFILTSLEGIGKTLPDKKLQDSIEKIHSLKGDFGQEAFSNRQEKLHVDFSMIGGMKQNRELLKIVQEAIEKKLMMQMEYTDNKLVTSSRTIEPLTLVFKWRGWYLYAFCSLRENYRLFRINRIRSPRLLDKHFKRKEKSFTEFEKESMDGGKIKMIDLLLKFDPLFKTIVEDFFHDNIIEIRPTGEYIVKTRMPEDGWLYGFLLSYGPYLEVLEPSHIRDILSDMSGKIHEIYES